LAAVRDVIDIILAKQRAQPVAEKQQAPLWIADSVTRISQFGVGRV